MTHTPRGHKSTGGDSKPRFTDHNSLADELNLLLYPAELNEHELKWQRCYSLFQERGFVLRPRYRSGWSASWVGTALDPSNCEDALRPVKRNVMDAKDVNTERSICIKRANGKSDEIEICRYLSSEKSLQNSKNHCVPLLDAFQDPRSPETSYLVMPLLRRFDDPEFGAVGEVVDFVTQVLEGMEFMHSQAVAHGDLTGANIMMDGFPIFPNGWHFVVPTFSADAVDILKPLPRIDHPVRYYIIDFDVSVRFKPGESPVRLGLGGRDCDPPELSNVRIPFDHYKLDVFTAGNVFLKEFRQKYVGLDFLSSTIELMMAKDPARRSTAQDSLQHWYKVKAGIDVGKARWRLRKPSESIGEQFMGATLDGLQSLKFMLNKGEKPRTWANP